MKAKIISTSVMLLIITFFIVTSEAQTSGPVARFNFGARLELKDTIYNGAGQDAAGFKNYFELMPANSKPSVFTHYFQLKDLTPTDFDILIQELRYYEKNYNIYLIPHIGLP